MQTELRHEHRVFLSTDLASRSETQFARAAVLASAVLFFAAAPFATRPLAHVTAFIPAYQSAQVISDLITAVLLFGQFSVLRSRGLLVLAAGYLFIAAIAVTHAVTFPDVLSPTGLLGAGPQSAAWLYTFWHDGFPLAVILYALLDDKRHPPRTDGVSAPPSTGASRAILGSVAVVVAVVCALTFVATAYHDWLPVLVVSQDVSRARVGIRLSVPALSLVALVMLWRRRPHTVLDLWLMVVMWAWLFDIALSGVLNAGRYDFGWYAGRIYGLAAASFLLSVLLIESGTHYARLVRLSAELSAANRFLEQLSLHDGLTNLANRRFFDSYLSAQIAIAHRHERMLALVLCDIDAFKEYNDHYGHQAGDECLTQVAAALRSCCRRPADMAARYGGEEFAMILPDTGLIGAAQIAEAAREAVVRLEIPHEHSPAGPYVSISGGVAVLRRTDTIAQQLITAADQTLYQAKKLGRNRMVSVPPDPG
jgi:diguanylate cyclase (GGDEF)-like protein